MCSQGLEVGHDKDIKAVYSNGLDSSQSDVVRAQLTRMGFSQEAPQEVVSLHLTDEEHGTSHAVAFHKERCVCT